MKRLAAAFLLGVLGVGGFAPFYAFVLPIAVLALLLELAERRPGARASFGLGFASTMGQVQTGTLGAGDYYWGGAASTIFWVDPKEDLSVVFMTQLMPSGTFNFRGQLKSIVYSSIID